MPRNEFEICLLSLRGVKAKQLGSREKKSREWRHSRRRVVTLTEAKGNTIPKDMRVELNPESFFRDQHRGDPKTKRGSQE